MPFTIQEIQAMIALLNRLPMSPAEQQWVMNWFNRLAAFCAPPKEQGEAVSEPTKGEKTDEE